MSTTLVPAYTGNLPNDYHSLVSTEYKISYAQELAELARTRGLTPVAVSVTGSTLRGQDTETSDVDATVLVEEKNKKATTWSGDVSVQSLDRYVEKLSTSVPYVEFLRSPFMVVDPRYRAYLASQVVNPYVLAVHAQRFCGHTWFRNSSGEEKSYRHCVATWHLINQGSPLVPRRYMDRNEAPAEFWSWLEQSLTSYQESASNRRKR